MVTPSEEEENIPKTDLVPIGSMPTPWFLQLSRDGRKLEKALSLGAGGLPRGSWDRAVSRGPVDGAGNLWPWAPWAVRASCTIQSQVVSSLPGVSSGR